ncbi:MAG: helix-turn-helix domain-containing protein, partial [Verrucomicrobia bacterium]|nr:helix-turn-helix domain-containing protein [Verrucomicrobiota bacterium]
CMRLLCPNLVGPQIVKLRFERGWTQEMLAVKLQLQDWDVSREVIANIESGRTAVTADQLIFFAKVFRVPFTELYPLAYRELIKGPEPPAQSVAVR